MLVFYLGVLWAENNKFYSGDTELYKYKIIHVLSNNSVLGLEKRDICADKWEESLYTSRVKLMEVFQCPIYLHFEMKGIMFLQNKNVLWESKTKIIASAWFST